MTSEELYQTIGRTPRPVEQGEALLAYIGGFEARDAAFIARLFALRGLAEIPMLEPRRLVGTREIEAGHRATFATVVCASFEAAQPVAVGDDGSVWVGTLAVSRGDGRHDRHELAMVSECREGALERLTLYLDTRNQRRWSDRAIL